MLTVRVSPSSWLIINERTSVAVYMITEGPAVWRETGETHIMCRIDWFHPERAKRHTVHWEPGLQHAQRWCKEQIERVVTPPPPASWNVPDSAK